jgi:hypothetical protein
MYICSALPEEDVFAYWERHKSIAETSGWEIEEWNNSTCRAINGDYIVTGNIYDIHPNDIESGTSFPENYKTVEIVVCTTDESIPKEKRETPWACGRIITVGRFLVRNLKSYLT